MSGEFSETSESSAVVIDNYGPHLDVFRSLFVSSLENRIYEALETFVYNDAELLSKFPNLRRCLNIFKLCKTIYQRTRDPEARPIDRLLSYAFKHLIQDGLITSFLNAILLNNRLNRVCRDLDSMNVDKYFLKFRIFPELLNRTDQAISTGTRGPTESLLIETPPEPTDTRRAVKRKASDNTDNRIISEVSVVTSSPTKAKSSDPKRIINKVSTCGPLTCSFYRSRTANLSIDFDDKNLQLKINKTHTDGVDEKRLKLPCQSADIIDDLITSDPSVMISCFGNVKRKFKVQIRKICTAINRILGRIDRKRVKKCVLCCKILGSAVLFRLKHRGRNGSRSCLFSDRVITRETSMPSAETVPPEQRENYGKIEDNSQHLLSNSGNSEETFYSGEDTGDWKAIKPGFSVDRWHHNENQDRSSESNDSRLNIARCSSFYSCGSFGASDGSKAEWCSAVSYLGYTSDNFTEGSEQSCNSDNPGLEKDARIVKEKLLNVMKCNSNEHEQLKREFSDSSEKPSHSELEPKMMETLKAIFRNENSDPVSVEEKNVSADWSSDAAVTLRETSSKIDEVSSQGLKNEAKSMSIQTIAESHQNNSNLESKILRMLESIFKEAEAKVFLKKKLQDSLKSTESTEIFGKILRLLLDISSNITASKISKASIITQNGSQTHQQTPPKNCLCANKKTKSIFTQTSPRNFPKLPMKNRKRPLTGGSGTQSSEKSNVKSFSHLFKDTSKNLEKKSQKNLVCLRENSERQRKSVEPPLICILQESEERTLKCLTSASEVLPALSPTRSGTFIISGSGTTALEKFSEIDDLFSDIHLMDALSSSLSVLGSSRCKCPRRNQKPRSPDEKLLFLAKINRYLRIILNTMHRRLKIIFSQSAFDRLRHLIKQKLYPFILEREKSTNTSHVRTRVFSIPRRHSGPFEVTNPADKSSENWKIEKNCGEKILRTCNQYSGDHSRSRGTPRRGHFQRKVFLREEKFREFLKEFNGSGSPCTCCSQRINLHEYLATINSRRSCGAAGVHVHSPRCGTNNSSIYQYLRGREGRGRGGERIGMGGGGGHCQIFSSFDSTGRIAEELRGMLVEHLADDTGHGTDCHNPSRDNTPRNSIYPDDGTLSEDIWNERKSVDGVLVGTDKLQGGEQHPFSRA
ncbi:uncharacterized protein LOC135165402 [Diachasmimorpha longicaudata]|uniref:uncharacterized protein LOC135165402 n=1 Tax=Diachasmimorpha longicaudata TaxID=58733 RepID=UPI0030B8DA51